MPALQKPMHVIFVCCQKFVADLKSITLTMRYSIMLQLVGLITLALLGAAAQFAWIQNRSVADPNVNSEHIFNE